ncbi:MAG: bacillithiol system redox-active protein YtxJ [Gracilimonas sp.]|nr:bacillithiol system redox-active protein YtxJ [Gracilimonas sp.]
MFKSDKSDKMQHWNTVSVRENITSLIERSREQPQLIYKHSTRCSVSFITKEDLDYHVEQIAKHADLHLINVVEQRDLSNYLSQTLNIRHESPQALLLRDGQVTWTGSHWNVKAKEILSRLG